MLNFVLKRTIVCFVILNITQAIIHDRHERSIKADTSMDHVSGKEDKIIIPSRSLSGLGELRMRRSSESLTLPNVEIPNTERLSTAVLDYTTVNADDLDAGSLSLSDFDEPVLNVKVSNTANPPPSGYDDSTLNGDAYISDYDDDTEKESITKYCFWYDNEKKKEYKIHNGTHWSGNGCKLFHCKNGVIIPDPSCCKIATLKHGFSLNYTLYQNHGEETIKACDVLACNSGSIKKLKRISGCCVYDNVKSMEDGESWWASPASPSDTNLCNKGTCKNGNIKVTQLEEGEIWGYGCFNYICEDLNFQVNKLDLPGSCMTESGSCITNGTTVKLWNECKGVMCVNGKLFKGFLPECSFKNKLLYKAYNH